MLTSYYPNLELVEYKFKTILHNSSDWKEKFNKIRRTQDKFAYEQYTVRVFPQTWGSTCTAFDITPTGESAIGGCALTDAYTTVICEETTQTYGVFIGNEQCYMVYDDITDEFFEDLKNCQMKPLSLAKELY